MAKRRDIIKQYKAQGMSNRDAKKAYEKNYPEQALKSKQARKINKSIAHIREFAEDYNGDFYHPSNPDFDDFGDLAYNNAADNF